MSLVSDILADIDAIRGDIPGYIGLRPFRAYVVTRTWSGGRVGQGAPTTTTTEITNAGRPVKVKQISDADVIQSGGLYNAGDVTVGPFTPAYVGGGVTIATFQPAYGTSPTEVLFKVTGPGYPAAGGLFKVKSNDGNFATRMTLVLSQTAATL